MWFWNEGVISTVKSVFVLWKVFYVDGNSFIISLASYKSLSGRKYAAQRHLHRPPYGRPRSARESQMDGRTRPDELRRNATSWTAEKRFLESRSRFPWVGKSRREALDTV